MRHPQVLNYTIIRQFKGLKIIRNNLVYDKLGCIANHLLYSFAAAELNSNVVNSTEYLNISHYFSIEYQ